MNKTNAELVKELMEVVGQYDSGLLTDYELLAKAMDIGIKVQWPKRGMIDQNTGLSYGVEDTPEKRQEISNRRDAEARGEGSCYSPDETRDADYTWLSPLNTNKKET